MSRIPARYCLVSALIAAFSAFFAITAYAMEQGHYVPGGTSLRDFIMPDKGFYFEQFNSFYYSDSFAGQDGKKIKGLGSDAIFNYLGYNADVGGGGDFEIRGFQYSTSPTLALVADLPAGGLKCGAAIAPAFGYVNGKIRIGDSEFEQSDSGLGDLYVQPVWLGWSSEHCDIMAGYGLYAPTGRYNNDRLANMGMGFWSHDLILTVAAYADKDRRTAVIVNTTYEFNAEKPSTKVRPGDALCLEYGVSQMLTKSLEAGVAGYSLFQTTSDSGAGVDYTDVLDFTNAVGCEMSYSMFNDRLSISARYMYEYAVRERLQGQLFVINAGWSF